MLVAEKIALVTGASRGIGAAVALGLAKEGADIIIHYYVSKDGAFSEKEDAEKIAEQVRAFGRRAWLTGFDISDPGITEEAIKKLLNEVQPDILVNNAGITADNLAMRMKDSEWQRVIDTNLSGSFFITRALLRPIMKNAGSIIFIASVVGEMGNTGQVNYAASKAGVIGMAKSLAKELAAKKVRVNVVAPGFIMTKMTEALSEEARNAFLAHIPFKEYGTPEDIANAVLFLASPLSRYITGSVLKVNGGLYM